MNNYKKQQTLHQLFEHLVRLKIPINRAMWVSLNVDGVVEVELSPKHVSIINNIYWRLVTATANKIELKGMTDDS